MASRLAQRSTRGDRREAGAARPPAAAPSEYVGEPPKRQDVPAGGLIHIEPGTPLQSVNHGAEDLIVYAYGTPPEDEHAELLESAV